MRRIAVTVLVASAWLVALAGPAAAHTVSGVGASNFRTTVGDIRPAIEDLELRVIDRGAQLELENRTGREVVVLGYQDEPMFRVGTDGAFENRRSPSVYVSRDRQGRTAAPPEADPEAAPQWVEVAAEPVVRWHDHRVHWMGQDDPPQAGRRHVVQQGDIGLRSGERTLRAAYQLEWIPGPSPVPWLLVALVLMAVPVVIQGRGWWRLGLVVCVSVMVDLDLIHVVGIVADGSGSLGSRLGSALAGSLLPLLGWIAGTYAMVKLLRGQVEDGLFGAMVAGLVVFLFGGLGDLSALTRSQVPFAFPTGLARVAVATSLGLAPGVVAASVLLLRRLAPPSGGDAVDPEVRPEGFGHDDAAVGLAVGLDQGRPHAGHGQS